VPGLEKGDAARSAAAEGSASSWREALRGRGGREATVARGGPREGTARSVGDAGNSAEGEGNGPPWTVAVGGRGRGMDHGDAWRSAGAEGVRSR
jgi:hypothetical protein